jgi:hypothetical protein
LGLLGFATKTCNKKQELIMNQSGFSSIFIKFDF